MEELERLGVEPSPSMLASFDPASGVVVIRSLITLAVVHSLALDDPPLAVAAPPPKRGRPPRAKAAKSKDAAASDDGAQSQQQPSQLSQQQQQRVVLPAMSKVSLSTTVRELAD